MWNISKEFDFCYGHRVWSQTLNKEYSIDNLCVCRHLHGHQGKVIVTLEGKDLIKGMVTDFKHLNWFKKFLDENLDHKFIVDKNDPLYNIIIPYPCTVGAVSTFSEWPLKEFKEGFRIINPDSYKMLIKDIYIELLEGFVIVDFVPTSENLSNWLFNIVKEKMDKIEVVTKSVQFYETPKSQSTYIG